MRAKKAPERPVRRAPVNRPHNEQEKLFCERWLRHHDHIKAWEEAGYSMKNAKTRARKKLEYFADYLAPLLEKKQDEFVKALALDQQELIREFMVISNCNPLDYLEVYDELDKKTGRLEGKVRTIPVHKLSRELASAIEVVINADGTCSYRLPNIKERLQAKTALGQHLGMFDSKLILEHRRAQLQKRADLRHVSDDALAQAERELVKVLGPVGMQLLGIVPSTDDEEESAGTAA